MNADERNVLVALMHPANSVNHRQAGAIQSALATIDALNEALGCERSRVANLVSRITGKPGDTTNEAVGEASRTANALRKAKDRLDAIDREAEFTHPQPTLDEAQALAVLMQGAAALARNPETREMAQRMADAVNALKEHGGRARKAPIDALRQQVATLTVERDEALARAMNAETEASIFRDDLAGAVAALRGEPQPRGLTDAGLDLFYGIEALKSGTTPRVKENT